jgi:hypothetical protein
MGETSQKAGQRFDKLGANGYREAPLSFCPEPVEGPSFFGHS